MRNGIGEFIKHPSEEPPTKSHDARKRCQICHATKDRRTTYTCHICIKFVCPEQIISYCSECANAYEDGD